MQHEPDLLDTLVSLVDTLIDNYDIIAFLHGLAERCVALLRVSEAGIMLADPDGRLQYAASSAEQMRLVELFEIQIDEGPCLDAYRSGEPVVSGSAEDADRRWPQFAPHARARGFASIAAVPMPTIMSNSALKKLNVPSTIRECNDMGRRSSVMVTVQRGPMGATIGTERSHKRFVTGTQAFFGRWTRGKAAHGSGCATWFGLSGAAARHPLRLEAA